MKIKNITLGSDPETFLQKLGSIISPQYIVWGTKDQPFNLDDGYFMQRDNMALEFNIPPVITVDDFVKAIDLGIYKCIEALPENVNIKVMPSFVFPKEMIDNDYDALVFGCDPDYNAYTNSKNPKPCSDNKYLRSCGGHIMLGYTGVSEELNIEIIKRLDLYLGLPSVILDPDTERRQLYGKAGCFRHKDFGVEYRTLSNYWLQSPELVAHVAQNTLFAAASINSGLVIPDNDQMYIESAINNNNHGLALELIHNYSIPMPVKQYNKTDNLIYYKHYGVSTATTAVASHTT